MNKRDNKIEEEINEADHVKVDMIESRSQDKDGTSVDGRGQKRKEK